MKVLLINYEYPPLGGGAGNATKHIGEQLAKLGCEVAVITTKYKNFPREEMINGVKIYRLPALRRRSNQSSILEMITFILSGIWHRKKVLRRFQPEVAIAFLGIPSGGVAWWYWQKNKIPYIVSLRGGDVPGTQPEQLKLYHLICKPLIKSIWRKAKYVVANSKGLRDLAALTLNEREILSIPNGVDLGIYQPGGEKSPAESVRLLYVGRVSMEKRLDLLIEALAELKHLNWKLQIVGEGPVLKELKQQVIRTNLTARIEFTGWKSREELVKFYQQADVFVFPSTSEGMPNVVLEAMACGLPVITSKIPGCEELVEEGVNGFLIEPRNKAHLIAGLIKLITSPEQRRQLGEQSRKKVKAYSWERVGQAYFELLQRMVSDD
ncbi:MAG: glycosyltransferase family 4 protein [Candidatus Sumerlaeia bacterium]|nr:glycosyltransferase family 4 protein [Candidatus Sumerlaeia bacterium]